MGEKKLKPEIEEVKENPMSAEFLEKKLKTFRQGLVWAQDIMDALALTVRTIEFDLQKINTEDKEANETDA